MSDRIHDLPENDRPRERLLRIGPGALSDAELLGIFINTGLQGENAVAIGRRLIQQSDGLRKLSRRDPADLAQQRGLGPAKAAVIAAAFELGRRVAREASHDQPLHQPELIFEYLGPEMQALNREEVHVLLLNTRMHLQHHERLYKGSVNESVAFTRDILRSALVHSAFAFVVVHNHPSGDPTPSEADRIFTRRLHDGAELLKVQLVDHIVIGHPSPTRALPYFSFRSAGLLPK